ncbi:hypothetical protein JRO89_XS13G0191400 [Xanthoceras sorbifolium]|uniref:RING-type E3 ubiquitin transferase n=1 Tax=Xanthoceras sorbifolium TaxID=99658 RepID=A0ABQ8H945_9ROSI|nr:hypothetical protein JRO89_XS13G0191400 [Xanthoceras sorbifolium]
MVMEILISVVLLFAGIAALVVIHVCIVGRAFRGSYENGRFVQGNVGGGGTKTMSNEDLKKLPSFKYKVEEAERGSGGGGTGTSSTLDCVVCLENFTVGGKCRLLPNCRHSFHAQCIDSWLLKAPICPICRTSACPPKIGVVLKEASGVSSDVGIEIT